MANDVMRQIRLLRQRLEYIGTELGLDMQNFLVVPSESEDGADMVSAVFIVRSEAIAGEKDADEAMFDEQFRAIAANFEPEPDEPDDAVLDELKDWMGDD